MKEPPELLQSIEADEPPPFLGTWKRVYTAVLLYLAAVIGVFWIFTVHFS